MNLGLKGGISIDADFGPLGYVLWNCGSRSWEVFTFFSDWFWPYCVKGSLICCLWLLKCMFPKNELELCSVNWTFLIIQNSNNLSIFQFETKITLILQTMLAIPCFHLENIFGKKDGIKMTAISNNFVSLYEVRYWEENISK